MKNIGKICPTCKTWKPFEEFNLNKRRKHGREWRCRQCRKSYRESNKEEIRNKKRIYYQENKQKTLLLVKKWREANPEKVRGYGRKYRRLNPDSPIVGRAHRQIMIAIENGVIMKPDICSICGSETRIHSHHEDYQKPLDVIWVCCKCHKQIHSKEVSHGN